MRCPPERNDGSTLVTNAARRKRSSVINSTTLFRAPVLRSEEITAAPSDNSVVKAGDATDRSSSRASLQEVCLTDAVFGLSELRRPFPQVGGVAGHKMKGCDAGRELVVVNILTALEDNHLASVTIAIRTPVVLSSSRHYNLTICQKHNCLRFVVVTTRRIVLCCESQNERGRRFLMLR